MVDSHLLQSLCLHFRQCLFKRKTGFQIADKRRRVARRYWEAFAKVLPEHLDFQGRMTSSHQNNASDPVNLALNYGYGFLEGELRGAINSIGLEPSVGFLHDFGDYQTKQSLVYDLQEPFRWLIDLSVVQAFERGALKLRDFYFTGDNYRYHFEVDAKQRFIDLVRDQFNAGVAYKGRALKWDTVIEQKANELSRFLTGKSSRLDFKEPTAAIQRFDNSKLREQIKSLTAEEAKRAGINKSTLYTLRQHIRSEGSFKLYGKVNRKLQALNS
jgi:CRISPR-associated protein Cas1